MLKRTRGILMMVGLCGAVAMASGQAPPCTGYNPHHNTNLACEIATTVRVSSQGTQSLGELSPTVAAQLSQLPITTAVSGSGLTFSRSLGVFTASTESLGTILTQRGETIGRHKFYLSFNYQRFTFDSIDGSSLRHLDTVNRVEYSSVDFVKQARNRVDLLVDQFTAIGSVGLTSRVDVSLLVPFSKVNLKTSSAATEFDVAKHTNNLIGPPRDGGSAFFAGSATGVGDVAVNLKGNVLRSERTKIALGTEVRFPTGNENNYLGTGAYGVKPYLVLSRSGRLTPNVNLGYQWNSQSPLFLSSTGAHLKLPASFLYSGGADYRVNKRLTLTAEFLGQYVMNGPRLLRTSSPITGQLGSFVTDTRLSSYTMNNIGGGFKANLFKGLMITGNALFSLDRGGLRSKVVPLVGISYKF